MKRKMRRFWKENKEDFALFAEAIGLIYSFVMMAGLAGAIL